MIPSTNQMCLQFWYHMYGDHIANLTVYSKTSRQMAVLWQKSGTQGPNWKHGVVDVSSATKFQVSRIIFTTLSDKKILEKSDNIFWK